MKIVTAAEMQRIDRLSTERFGVASQTLMENAGRGVVQFLEDHYSPLEPGKITVLCGRGNNGGDGMVVARLLQERGLNPRTVLLADTKLLQGDALANFERLSTAGPPEIAPDLEAWRRLAAGLPSDGLLIDAILGTGLSKPLAGFLLDVVRDLNRLPAGTRVIAVDLPTGISADSGELVGECVRADASVTFTAPKRAHVFPPACERVGKWEVRQIGTPPELVENDPELKLNLTLPEEVCWLADPRKAEAHKGNFGHVLLLAGSMGKTGAAALAAKAALRAGAGLVTVATPGSAVPVIASLGMEYMTEGLPETEAGTLSLRALDYGKLDRLVEGKSVLAVGPGLGNVAETGELVRTLVNRYDVPVVLDADGLNAFSGRMGEFRSAGRVRVMTPHPGEMARLTGRTTESLLARRIEIARDFAREYEVYLVLKGFRTLIAAPGGQVWVNPTGNPGMATGGTGDVLTGLVAGFLAQHSGRPAEQVASAAVYLHGLAGDLAASEKGQNALIAGDLVDALPAAFRSLGSRRR